MKVTYADPAVIGPRGGRLEVLDRDEHGVTVPLTVSEIVLANGRLLHQMTFDVVRPAVPGRARGAPDGGRHGPALNEPGCLVHVATRAHDELTWCRAAWIGPVTAGCRYAPGRPTPPEGTPMASAGPKSDPDRWWHGGVFYQIYPRSFADADGDGVGDLPGIISKLDHLARLGISGVWLSPVTCSPNRDWGYDVSDYRDVDPPGDARRPRHARPRGGRARDPHPLGPGAQPHQRPACLVRRRGGVGVTRRTVTTTSGPTPRPTAARPTTG